MISKAKLKYLRSLHLRKFRLINNSFLAEGEKICSEFLQSEKFSVKGIYATPNWISFPAYENDSRFSIINEDILKKISSQKSPNNVLIEVEIPPTKIPDPKAGFTLALDNIRDPGNLGTIIRSADWFGISDIICSENCVDLFNPKVVQASMGSLCRVNVFYTNLELHLKSLSDDINIYGTDMKGTPLREIKFSRGKHLVIIGNEAHGIRNELKTYIHRHICIPKKAHIDKIPNAESLNASIAASIILYESSL